MKNTKEKIQKRLPESTSEETQTTEKTWKRVLKVAFILCLFSAMIFSLICIFTGHKYISAGEYKYVGVMNTQKFYQAESCDMLKIKSVSDVTKLKAGDIVYYSSNVESGTGKYIGYTKSIVTLENQDKERFTINTSSIVGVQENKTQVIGLFVWFLTGTVGAISAFVILLTYVMYLTFSRINYENTSYGKQLLEEYKKWKKDSKQHKIIMDHVNAIDGFDLTLKEMLSGKFSENIVKYDQFMSEQNLSAQEKYKFILYQIHENLIEKPMLNLDEKRMISSVVEFLGKSDHIDNDIEYMLIDLLLKSKLVFFEVKEFSDLANSFLNSKIDQEDLFNFGSIFYILVKSNPRLSGVQIRKLINAYIKKSEDFDIGVQKIVKNISIGVSKSLK